MQRTILGATWYAPPMPAVTILDGPPPHVIGVVAIQNADPEKTWKARIGYGLGDEESIDQQLIAKNGARLSKEVACAYFPDLDPHKFKL